MKLIRSNRAQQLFLVATAVLLISPALLYGTNPQTELTEAFGFAVSTINQIHIFRGFMGLYLSMVLFWLLSAFIEKLRQPALYTICFFMFGLAAGRILSIILDGMPDQRLLNFLISELILGSIALFYVVPIKS